MNKGIAAVASSSADKSHVEKVQAKNEAKEQQQVGPAKVKLAEAAEDNKVEVAEDNQVEATEANQVEVAEDNQVEATEDNQVAEEQQPEAAEELGTQKAKDLRTQKAEGLETQKVYKCEICSDQFPWQASLSRHQRHYHGLGAITAVSQLVRQKYTQKQKSKEGSFKCETCGNSYVQYHSLLRHKQGKHAKVSASEEHPAKDGPAKCPICQKELKYARNIPFHVCTIHRNHPQKLITKAPEKQVTKPSEKLVIKASGGDRSGKVWNGAYRCEHCSAQFTWKQSCVLHVQKFHKEVEIKKLFQAGDEKKSVASPAKTEGGKKLQGKIVCPDCDKEYLSNKILRHHQLYSCSASKLKKSSTTRCKQCSRRFWWKSSYVRRMQTSHKGAEMKKAAKAENSKVKIKKSVTGRYVCNPCGKKFADKGHLRHHQMYACPNQAKNLSTVICGHCGRTFPSQLSLVRHTAYRHTGRGVLVKSSTGDRKKGAKAEPGAKTGSGAKAESGAKIGSGAKAESGAKAGSGTKAGSGAQCKFCGKCFDKAESLMPHQRVAHKLQFAKSFKWKCSVCSRKFLTQRSLLRHKKGEHGTSKLTAVRKGTVRPRFNGRIGNNQFVH